MIRIRLAFCAFARIDAVDDVFGENRFNFAVNMEFDNIFSLSRDGGRCQYRLAGRSKEKQAHRRTEGEDEQRKSAGSAMSPRSRQVPTTNDRNRGGHAERIIARSRTVCRELTENAERSIRGGLAGGIDVRRLNLEDFLDARIFDHRGKFGILFGGAEIFIAVVTRKLQVMGGVLGVAGLRVELREKKIEQAGVGRGTLLQNGAHATFFGEYVRIKSQGLAESTHRFGILLVAVISVAKIAVDRSGLLVALQSLLCSI